MKKPERCLQMPCPREALQVLVLTSLKKPQMMLIYRINLININLPPVLVNSLEDIILLIHIFPLDIWSCAFYVYIIKHLLIYCSVFRSLCHNCGFRRTPGPFRSLVVEIFSLESLNFFFVFFTGKDKPFFLAYP